MALIRFVKMRIFWRVVFSREKRPELPMGVHISCYNILLLLIASDRYGHYYVGAGSVLLTGKTCDDKRPELRFFTPSEIARLMGFKQDFSEYFVHGVNLLKRVYTLVCMKLSTILYYIRPPYWSIYGIYLIYVANN